MPVMIPCAMRVGSMLTWSRDKAENQVSWYTVRTINIQEDRHTSAWVRNPAGRP